MRWSRFVHVFPELGVIWQSLTFEMIRIEKGILKEIAPGGEVSAVILQTKQCSELLASGFIVEETDDVEPCLQKIQRNAAVRDQIQALYLVLSTKCNLRCSYCLYGSGQSGSLAGKGLNMRHEVACEAINLFATETGRNDRGKPGYWEEVTFYGGEPLLNPSCLMYCTKQIRQLQAKGIVWEGVSFVLNTNGTLFTKPILDYLKREDIRIHVSIDGLPNVHDRVRLFPSGTGSFEKVTAGLSSLSERGIEFVPLLTITHKNLENLSESVEWLCRKFGMRRYGLNLLMHTNGPVDPSYGEKAARSMREAHAIARSYGAVDMMYEDAAKVFSRKIVAASSCGAGRKLVVFPGGEIHACQALEASGVTNMGHLPSFVADSPHRMRWLQRNRFHLPVCLACPALGGCGGGCGASAINAGETLEGIDPNHCGWMKSLFRHWLSDACRQF